jgi:hypothetical protein
MSLSEMMPNDANLVKLEESLSDEFLICRKIIQRTDDKDCRVFDRDRYTRPQRQLEKWLENEEAEGHESRSAYSLRGRNLHRQTSSSIQRFESSGLTKLTLFILLSCLSTVN